MGFSKANRKMCKKINQFIFENIVFWGVTFPGHNLDVGHIIADQGPNLRLWTRAIFGPVKI